MAKQDKLKWNLAAEELSGFCAQLAMMLNSGMAIYEGMEILVQTHKDSPNAQAYVELNKAMNQTGSLYEAMKMTGGWPRYLVEMTGIGERTGQLEKVMNGLSEYYGREGRIRRAIVSAITYPVVLGVMMLLILLVMIIKVLPVFRRVLGNFGVEMTDSGNTMMQLGVGIGWVMLAVVAVVVLAVLICCLLMRFGCRDKVLAALRRVFPPLRNISTRLASARVASVLSMMIASGFPLDEALEMVPRVLDDAVAQEKIRRVRERVAGDVSFADALVETGLFDEFYSGLIRMGYTVGCADVVMGKVAAEYETRVEDGISSLVSIIEPSLVAILSIVIGAVLLSVMLPMAGIISSIL